MTRFLILFFLIPLTLIGQDKETKEFTKTLCSAKLHGRGYVNNGDGVAADYIAKTFEKVGLLKTNNTYFQPFVFPVNSFPGTLSLKINGTELNEGVDYLVSPESIGGEFTYKPIYLKGEDLFDIKKIQSLINDNLAVLNERILLIRNVGYSKDSTIKIKQLIKRLNELVAVGEITDEKLIWSVSQKTSRFPSFLIQDSILTEKINLIELIIESKFIPNHEAKNVIGYLPAKKKTDKIIVFSAHYDHLGRMGSRIYFPGANDNASGVAMLVHLAKHFKENPSKYNIYFIAFAGEEAGLIGSKFMAKHPLFDLKKISFLLNLDIMGSGEEGITIVNGSVHKKAFKKMLRINKRINAVKNIKARGKTSNSDHYWFSEKGVPAFFIYTRGPNKHYHDIYDTYEELSFEAFENIANLLMKFTKRCL